MLSAAFVLTFISANSLPAANQVLEASHAIPNADLMFMSSPTGDWPVRVMLASHVSATAAEVEKVIRDPASYAAAMPSFKHVRVVSQAEREPGIVDTEVAWELDIPLRNLKGKLWLRPEPDGVDVALVEGDFSPGLLQLRARPESGSKKDGRCLLTIEGSTNVRDINWATRKLVQRSALAEPAITAAAVFVMAKSLATLAEGKGQMRPKGAMTAPHPSQLDGTALAKLAGVMQSSGTIWAAVHSRPNGRLFQVQVATSMAVSPDKAQARSLRPATFTTLPGWKRIVPVAGESDACKDMSALCWRVDNNLPVFSLSGTWKLRPRPWRALMVSGDTREAAMGIDLVPSAQRTVLVLSQHPRLDEAGFVARKLIEAEPLLEHGLALALTLVDAVALGPALENSP